MSKNRIFVILIICLTSVFANAQNIVGENLVCHYNCETYEIQNASGGLFIWTVDGGKLEVNTGTSVTICWKESGEHEIKVLDLSPTASIPILTYTVTVEQRSFPEIYFPEVPNCATLDSIVGSNQEFPPLECYTACEKSTGIYTALGAENSVFDWTISGGNLSDESGESIDIYWGDAGYGYIVLNETTEAGCENPSEYCVQILERPEATIIDETNISSPCIGQSIYLKADSPEAIEFSWDINGMLVSDEQTLEYKIETNDVLNILLITISECLCQDTTNYVITPQPEPGPQINCVGTTCLGSEETYYAEDICGTYNWSVSGEGTITDGGGANDNYITVNWNSGPIGELMLTASSCQNTICTTETTLQVPIIEPTVDIDGPSETCKQGISIFSIPKFTGTSYVWSLAGNGFIIDGQNTNQISVQWENTEWADNQSTISVTYENCLLECSGSAQKIITLKPEFIISSWEPEVCIGENLSVDAFSGYSSARGDWEVIDKDGVVIATEIDKSSITFVAPNKIGLLEVTMTNNSGTYCNDSSTGFVTVIAPPEQPTSFDGPLVVCLNEIYSYSASVDLPENIQLIWTFNDGGSTTVIESNDVNYTWTSAGPYSIELVSKSIVSNCESESLSVEVKEASTTSIVGSTEVCVGELSVFSLTGVESENIQWTIMPSTAGNFKKGDGIDTEIIFYETGNHQLTANYCGTNLSVNVDVYSKPTISYNAPIGICANEKETLTIITEVNNSIEVSDENFNVVGTSSSLELAPGIYTIKAISPFGCEEIKVLNIDKYDIPDIRISSPEETGVCQFPFDVKIYASDAIDGYIYKWFKDDIEIPLEISDTLIANEYANYHLEVTNINGCVNKSNTIKVYEECRFPNDQSDGRCENLNPCESLDSINFNYTNLGFCNTYSFTNNSTSNVDPASLRYDFDDIQSGIFNIVSQPNAEHTFSHAGFYSVMLIGSVPYLLDNTILCDDFEAKVIEVPVAANFESQEACSNVEYEFLDKSTFVANNTIVGYEWDFDDPTTGLNNTSTERNPKHLFSKAGTFNVALTITAGTGCKAKIIKAIRILQSPEFELNLPFEQCVSEPIKFEAVDTGNLIKFIWEFDDPTGGLSNYVENASTIHQFQTPGIYSISLTAQNNLGCESTEIKTFEVGVNNLTGDITLDKTLPICEGDSITLTAPNGGAGYVWSNGEITQSVKVVDAEKYSVTVLNATACDYIPEPISVVVKPRPNIQIFGITYDDQGFDGTVHYDGVEVCEGEFSRIRTQNLSNATYEWSTGSTFWFDSDIDTRVLTPGQHEFTVKVTTDGCTFTSDPFVVTIHPRPQNVTISSNVSLMCEGDVFNLTVDNPNSNFIYYWSTGQTGTSINAQLSGRYSVRAINEFGCSNKSNTLTIHKKPNMSFFQTGCFETCFPDEICFPLSANISLLSWIKDGQVISGENSDVLTVTEAGEYQVMIESLAGCVETSEILTLEAMPSDQSVSGTVYVDDNNNGIYDSTEELLENITINLMSGTTVLSSAVTDASGMYLIDPVNAINTYLLLDTIGTGLNLTNLQMQYDLVFDLCIEDKVQDFPVTKECEPIVENLDLVVCEGETVMYNNTTYSAGDTDNITIVSATNCDSIINLTVTETQVPIINSTTSPSCQGSSNGELNILTNQVGLNYSIDGINFSTNTDYENLAPGNYNLEVTNENNCNYTFPFIVQEITEPNIIFTNTMTCPQEDSGSIELTSSETGLSYSLDGLNYSNNNIFNNLADGNYDVYVMDANGCQYSYTTDIVESQEPNITFATTASCPSLNNGSFEITSSDAGTMFSLDGSNFGTDLIYENLNPGNQILYVSNNELCVFEFAVDIPETALPAFNTIATNTCSGESNGMIEIQSTNLTLTYSIDGVNFSSQNIFTNLDEGNQTVYIQNDIGCIYEEGVSIQSYTTPDLTLNTTLSCNDDGTLEILINDGNSYSYSLTNSGFATSNQFTSLTPGDYSVFVLDNNNCVTEELFTIEESIEPLLQFEVTPSCASDANGSITVVSNNTLVEYAIEGGVFSSSNVFDNISEGSYTISIMDEFGCLFDNEITIDAIESLEVNFEDPAVDCSISSIPLIPEIISGENLTYSWSDGSSSDQVIANQSGLYEVEITNGCETAVYQWDLQFENFDVQSIYVPNVFAPDVLGDNSSFKAFKPMDLDVMEFDLTIFDKWGNKVFENTDMNQTWDGRYNSEKVQTGVYVWKYSMTGNYCNEVVTLNDAGSVTVLR